MNPTATGLAMMIAHEATVDLVAWRVVSDCPWRLTITISPGAASASERATGRRDGVTFTRGADSPRASSPPSSSSTIGVQRYPGGAPSGGAGIDALGGRCVDGEGDIAATAGAALAKVDVERVGIAVRHVRPDVAGRGVLARDDDVPIFWGRGAWGIGRDAVDGEGRRHRQEAAAAAAGRTGANGVRPRGTF